MNIERIDEILADSFGQVDKNSQPKEGSEVVNLYLANVVLKTEKVYAHAAEMVELLKDWPQRAYGAPVPILGTEISFIAAGRALESQRRAFVLFAFGSVLDWWTILDPHTVLGLQYDDPQGEKLARSGFVSIIGYSPNG